MDELGDADLLATWRGGDQEAFSVLVARYHGLVRAACSRQVASGEADDCVQAVFLVLARRPAAAARVPSLAAWLLRVSIHVCRRARRSARSRQRAESVVRQARALASDPMADQPEALGHLDDCLQRLPDRQRSAVVMHYLAGHSADEVAALLGTTRDNAYQLLSRGLAGLRTLLARRGVAIGATALATLLASESQAATATVPLHVISTLTLSPSAGASALAKGAITSMSIATATPLACVAGVVLAVATTAAVIAADPAPATPIDLKGYGTVSAELNPARTVFDCDSPEKADVLMDKLQADLFWDPNLPAKQGDIKVGAATVTSWTVDGYGSAVIARSGRKVVVIGAADGPQVAALAQKDPLLAAKDVSSHAAKPRPIWLDFYDHRAFKAFNHPMRGSDGFGFESHWPFMQSLGGAEIMFGPTGYGMVPGLNSYAVDDAEMAEAERLHEMQAGGRTIGGGEMPNWVWNTYPDTVMRPTDTTLLGEWGGAFMTGGIYESWSTPIEQRIHTGLDRLRRGMERYRNSPAMGGWMLFAGSPGVEYSLGHGRSMNAWDASPTGQRGLRKWLQEQRKLSLAEVGTRWYGDARRFASWDDVRVPDINEFYGAFGADSLRLATGWRWQNVEDLLDPLPGDGPWVPIAMPPSQQQAFISRKGSNYFDITVDAGTWLGKQKPGADVWLVFSMIGTGGNGVRVWLNDSQLRLPGDWPSRDQSFAIKVSGLLKPGPNHLQVGLNCAVYQTCAGKLAGPVFFTTHEPKRFPYLGAQANARYLDLTEWRHWAISAYHRDTVAWARKLDPDRPFILSGGSEGLYDYGSQLAADFGMGMEHTGREANYGSIYASGGLASGFYGTSEFSATATGEYLDRAFGWIMFDADSDHGLYYDIDAYQKREAEDGWFSKHRRQIQLFGKYLRVQPQVAVFYSAQNQRLRGDAWHLGEGHLQAAHFDNVYISEPGLKSGLANRYPVLWDQGSPCMDREMVAGIRAYVEQGGTFVAVNNSGQHTLLEPDANPLAELSGFRIAGGGRAGKVRFVATPPILKGWADREFGSHGVPLEPIAKDPALVALARWNDGTVAVGCRQVGKGRIVTLGSWFWHDDAQLREELFESLFADCGIARTVNADSPDIWARKMVTKNGLQHWLIAFNTTKEDREAELWMATDGKPEAVIDLDTNQPVAFTCEDKGVKLKGVTFAPYALRAFAVRRATLAGGLPVWWGEKTFYWKRTAAEVAAGAMILPDPPSNRSEAIIPIEQWRFRADPDRSIAGNAAWTAAAFDDKAWKPMAPGRWDINDPSLKGYQGTGLYRFAFTVPPGWNGRRILVNAYDLDTPIIFGNGEFLVNGVKVGSYKQHGWSQTYNFDVTAQVHPGENILALETVGNPTLGGFGGLGGTFWIEARSPLAPSVDLQGGWQGVRGDWLGRFDVGMGERVTAKYLVREVKIPAEWKGRSVFLDWSSKDRWIGSVVINGHPINFNGMAHPYGLICRLNVGPYLKPGDGNTIEIWPFRCMPWTDSSGDSACAGLQLDDIRIGCK